MSTPRPQAGPRPSRPLSALRRLVPRALLLRMRLLFTLFYLGTGVTIVPFLVSDGSGQPAWLRALAMAGFVAVGLTWALAYRRRRPGWLPWLLEPVVFTTIGVCLPVPMNVLMLAFAGILYWSLYGSTPAAWLRTLSYLGVVVAVVSLSPNADFAVLSVETLGRTPIMVAVVVLMRMLYGTVQAAERVHERQALLSEAGTRLLRLARRDEVVEAGVDVLQRLAAVSTGRLDAVLVIGRDGTFGVAGGAVDGRPAPAGHVLASEQLRPLVAPHLEVVPDELAATLAALPWTGTTGSARWYGVPVQARGHRYGYLLVSAAQQALQDDADPLLVVANQLAFALASSRAAWHDTLTDLANRALLQESVLQATERGAGTAVIYLDLDGFKAVNDTYGHATGDAVLVEVAHRLRGVVRPGDLAARLGGDEFAVLLHDVTTSDEARGVAQRVLRSLEEPVHVDGRALYVGGSIGVALGGSDLADAVRLADVAMYRAKAAGKGRVEVFSADEDAQMLRHDVLRRDLPMAVRRGELAVHYQPVVDVTSGRTVAVEALVRWYHPHLGTVPPLEFIPVAESDGHIVEIGEWVLRTAVAEVAGWRADGIDLELNVNVSPLQLTDPLVTTRVMDALEEAGLPASALVLEVTESALVSDPAAVERLIVLNRAGVRIAVDDFGTGYASMAYLQKLPVDVVKIDRSFVATIGLVPAQPELARASVLMARSLGLTAVAEGVENMAQLDALREYGCDLAQGYALLRPQSAAELRTWLVGTGHQSPVTTSSGS